MKLEIDLTSQIIFGNFFGVHKPENQKTLGPFEVESINDQCLVTLAVNPK